MLPVLGNVPTVLSYQCLVVTVCRWYTLWYGKSKEPCAHGQAASTAPYPEGMPLQKLHQEHPYLGGCSASTSSGSVSLLEGAGMVSRICREDEARAEASTCSRQLMSPSHICGSAPASQTTSTASFSPGSNTPAHATNSHLPSAYGAKVFCMQPCLHASATLDWIVRAVWQHSKPTYAARSEGHAG